MPAKHQSGKNRRTISAGLTKGTKARALRTAPVPRRKKLPKTSKSSGKGNMVKVGGKRAQQSSALRARRPDHSAKGANTRPKARVSGPHVIDTVGAVISRSGLAAIDVPYSPGERFVRVCLRPVDGESWRILLDVILDPNDQIIGRWSYFGLWAPEHMSSRGEGWPIVLDSDGIVSTGEEVGELYETRLRRLRISNGVRVLLTEVVDDARVKPVQYAFEVLSISELGRRPVNVGSSGLPSHTQGEQQS